MRWVKRGKIFDPSQHGLSCGGAGYAQAPQALVLSDRVRIYFSTREIDSLGKFISHVSFVDFDRNMTGILDMAKLPLLPPSGLGCFDEHGIFPFNILDDGDRVLAFTTGWSRRVSVSADAAIGLAISHDNGVTFKRYGQGPVLAASLHEPFLIGDGCVVKIDGNYHMWYIFGVRWTTQSLSEAPDRVYKIAHAVSEDAIHWRRDSVPIISDKINEDECQALPSVFKLDGVYHMYFCYRHAHGFRTRPDKAYRLGYAYSTDMVNWVRDDDLAGITVSSEGWDSQMQCYPNVFACDERIFMLYNGNEFGRYGFGLAELIRD